MYDPIAYSYTVDLTEYDKNLYVISAGSYKFSLGDRPVCCYRPNGRDDYHFCCVINGRSECIVDGKSFTLRDGQGVFYDYMAPQSYEHFAENGTKIYWIHFNGHSAVKLLRECGFDKSCIFSFDTSVSVQFDNILNELTFKDGLYVKSCSANLYSIIVSLARGITPKQPRDERIHNVLYMMHNRIHNHLTLDDYAKISGLSKPQFIKCFTKYTGMTPIQYKNKQVLNDAAWYLKNTTKSIKEISALLKFENSYYFSNMFKKNMGLSPKAYREKCIVETSNI